MAEKHFSLRKIVVAVVACMGCAPMLHATAQDADKESALKLSGFASIVGGRVVGGELGDDYVGPASIDGVDCPCYTADWHNAGIYREKFSLKPESRAGLQAKYTLTKQINLVAQVVIRGSDPKPNVQWAYASFAPSKNWEVQVGRKRIPLYFYSDFQDIGVAFPWISVPPELYGWEASNYNGASVRYKGALGESNLNASLFTGKETLKDANYYKLYYTDPTKVTWRNLVGGDLELTRGPLTTRAVYMQSDVGTVNVPAELDDKVRLKAYGVAANLDLENWFVLAELTQLTRDFDAGYRVTAPAVTIGAGYRFGAWTPFVNYARYTERTDDLDSYAPTSWTRAAVTLRYDVDSRSAVKAQVDRHKDTTRNFGGTVTMVRLAYDRLF